MKQEKVERIDRITHGSLHRDARHLIWELADQGYTHDEIREYFQMKHLEFLQDIKEITDRNQEKDYEQKHWENLTTHYERFTDY